MRPSDENQAASSHPHLRPNLMSSARRSGHEDSILAKLEREPARREHTRIGKRLAWYGCAALAALSLTAILAWLAAGSGPQALEVAHGSASRPAPNDAARPSSAQAAQEFPQPLQINDSQFARIVDAAPAQASAQAYPQASPHAGTPPHRAPPATLPPLRMLDAPAARPPPVTPTAAAAAAAPAWPARVVPAAAPGAKTQARAGASRTRPAAVRSSARQAPRAARAGEHDDSDVALISAVIYHANGHAVGEAGSEDTSSCADDACRARPPRQ